MNEEQNTVFRVLKSLCTSEKTTSFLVGTEMMESTIGTLDEAGKCFVDIMVAKV
jgi:hypothetical protein